MGGGGSFVGLTMCISKATLARADCVSTCIASVCHTQLTVCPCEAGPPASECVPRPAPRPLQGSADTALGPKEPHLQKRPEALKRTCCREPTSPIPSGCARRPSEDSPGTLRQKKKKMVTSGGILPQ